MIISEPHLPFKNKLISRVAEKDLEILSNVPKTLMALEKNELIWL